MYIPVGFPPLYRYGSEVMTKHALRNLRITNYKSIDSLRLDALAPFSVFAGANGSGKSNFFAAMEFVTKILRFDVDYALRNHGGYDSVRSLKRRSPRNTRFEFSLECDLPNPFTHGEGYTTSRYELVVHNLPESPAIEERLSEDDGELLARTKDGLVTITGTDERRELPGFAEDHSALLFFRAGPLPRLLTNMTVYRFEPGVAKEPDRSGMDPTALWGKGINLATVLRRMESSDDVRNTISGWMETVVPGIDSISTKQQSIDQTTTVLFKERGTRRRFPARLMSDGTIYALCLLVAVLDRINGHGVTMIEEPERGLHPSAIREIVAFLRERASPANPIWLTTHSESVVRELRLEELVLVDKVKGRTIMKRADSGNLEEADIAQFGLRSAWLSNLLGGGLPW